MSMIKTYEDDMPLPPTNIKRELQDEIAGQIAEFKANGNKIQVCPIGESGYKHKTVWVRTDAWEISQAMRQ